MVRLPAKKMFLLLLPMAVFLLSSHLLAHEQPQSDQISAAKPELPLAAPDLADIIPLATELSGRLAALENKVTGEFDVSAAEKEYLVIEGDLKVIAGQLQGLKDLKDYRSNQLAELREKIEQENELLEEANNPLSEAIRQLGMWRKDWLAEKKRWDEFQSDLFKEEGLDQLKPTFIKAHDTIDAALNRIHVQLEVMLSVQEKGGTLQANIKSLAAEVDSVIYVGVQSVLLEASPSMFSPRYFSQFGSELWYAVKKGLDEISWPDRRFFDRLGWVVLLQGLLSLAVIGAVYQNRQAMNGSKRWRFIAARPFSAGLFFGTIATLPFYEYGGIPDTWRVITSIVSGISIARLLGVLLEASWKRHFVYTVAILLISARLMYAVNLPLPLFRLYTVLAALVVFFFFVRWAGDSVRHKDSGFYTWSLRLGSCFFAIIIISQLWGKEGLAEYLFLSSILSMGLLIVFMLFTHMIRGGVEWVFHGSPLRRTALVDGDARAITRRVTLLIDCAIWGLLILPGILMIWGVYPSLAEALTGLLAMGFNLGSQRITVGLLVTAVGILYGSFLISWILQALLMDEVLVKRRMERGVRLSISRLIHYVIIVAGFLWAISTLGFNVTNLTIILSALGVGIGFGLQGAVNNFISGLILLFERPVRVGDYIEIGGQWAAIKRIGLRATTAQTFDQADVIIPNADLITNQVTNWTLSNRQVRVTIPVGVAYGSDVALVMETLTACANANAKVAKQPLPQVLFLSFGESTLDFELRAWVSDVDFMMQVKSELHQEIDRRFREAGIVIDFPQRDVRLVGTEPLEIRMVSEKETTDKK